MQIVYRKIEELKPADYNPRRLTELEHKELTKSLQRFGFAEPIVINSAVGRENVIIGGHQRLMIAKELGIVDIPCVEVNLPIDKERELNLRLNKNVGEWDFEELANNFDLELLRDVGFTPLELGMGVPTDDAIDDVPDDIVTVTLSIPQDKFAVIHPKIEAIKMEFGIDVEVS